MPITTAMCSSFKAELMKGMHCFTGQLTPTGNITTGNQTITAVSAITDLCRGMPIAAAQLAANTFIEDILSSSSISVSRAPTGTATGATLTCSGDAIKMALIKVAPAGTYGAGTTNYSQLGADEVTGTGYTAGGTLLNRVTPSLAGTTAITTFSPSPTWVGATFSTTGALIHNSSMRGSVAGRAVSTHDFNGTQSVTAGTFTVVMPPADANNAILRIG
jgi:hypothetical protein